MKIPTLNAEVKSVLSRISLRKDNFNQIRQLQLGAVITALGSCLTAVLNIEEGKDVSSIKDHILENLGDSTRLLMDLFHKLTEM